MDDPSALLQYYHLHLVSDSTAETLATIGKAAAVQHPQKRAIEHIYPLVRTERQLIRVLSEIRSNPGMVVYTIVNRELAAMLEQECEELNIPCVPVLGAINEAFEQYLGSAPPKLPEQGTGPHFTINNGRLEFAPQEALDAAGNDVAKLNQLHPVLREAVADLVSSLADGKRGNIAHGRLLDITQKYQAIVDSQLSEIPIARLFGYGLRLGNIAAASARAIADRDLPELDDDQREALDSVLDIHGAFIMATVQGQELVITSERYQRNPAEDVEFSRAAAELGSKLEGEPDIAEPSTATFIKETADAAGAQDQPERNVVFGIATMKNVAIALTSGALIAVCAAIATSGGTGAAILGGIAGLAVVEGTKKSKAFSSLSKAISEGLDSAAELDSKKLSEIRQNQLVKIADFVIQNEALIRRMAGDRKEFRWLHNQLDWLKKQRSRENPDK